MNKNIIICETCDGYEHSESIGCEKCGTKICRTCKTPAIFIKYESESTKIVERGQFEIGLNTKCADCILCRFDISDDVKSQNIQDFYIVIINQKPTYVFYTKKEALTWCTTYWSDDIDFKITKIIYG